jgi:hypothetical protein
VSDRPLKATDKGGEILEEIEKKRRQVIARTKDKEGK